MYEWKGKSPSVILFVACGGDEFLEQVAFVDAERFPCRVVGGLAAGDQAEAQDQCGELERLHGLKAAGCFGRWQNRIGRPTVAG